MTEASPGRGPGFHNQHPRSTDCFAVTGRAMGGAERRDREWRSQQARGFETWVSRQAGAGRLMEGRHTTHHLDTRTRHRRSNFPRIRWGTTGSEKGLRRTHT